MPIYDFRCPKHGVFEIAMPLREYDDKKPCIKKGCALIAEQVHLPRGGGRGQFAQPIVIHVSADGRTRFPGSPDAKLPKGFVKRELKTIRDIEGFERQMNERLKSEAQDHQEREERHFGAIQERNRSDLRMAMQSMSPIGRAFAEHAIKVNNARRRKSTDMGFRCSILHEDASKSPQIDVSTGWKRKYF